MLDIRLIRQDPDAVAIALAKKNYQFDVAHFRSLDGARKQADTESQQLLADSNSASKKNLGPFTFCVHLL
jgi:seryl-tRNA synthetase